MDVFLIYEVMIFLPEVRIEDGAAPAVGQVLLHSELILIKIYVFELMLTVPHLFNINK